VPALVHRPAWQIIVPVHAEHAPPLAPHFCAVGAKMQVVPSQQPEAQVDESQDAAQTPLAQI